MFAVSVMGSRSRIRWPIVEGRVRSHGRPGSQKKSWVYTSNDLHPLTRARDTEPKGVDKSFTYADPGNREQASRVGKYAPIPHRPIRPLARSPLPATR